MSITKKYNLTSKSDMRRWKRDFEKEVFDNAKKQALNQKYEIECPNCNNEIMVTAGINPCPSCGKEINLVLDFDI